MNQQSTSRIDLIVAGEPKDGLIPLVLVVNGKEVRYEISRWAAASAISRLAEALAKTEEF
jgi:hypothetical protein